MAAAGLDPADLEARRAFLQDRAGPPCPRATLADVVAHIEHAREVAGRRAHRHRRRLRRHAGSSGRVGRRRELPGALRRPARPRLERGGLRAARGGQRPARPARGRRRLTFVERAPGPDPNPYPRRVATPLDAAVRALALQVNRETVLQARATLLAEADRLDIELGKRAHAYAGVGLCGGDPVSPEAASAFNERINALVAGCLAYNRDFMPPQPRWMSQRERTASPRRRSPSRTVQDSEPTVAGAPAGPYPLRRLHQRGQAAHPSGLECAAATGPPTRGESGRHRSLRCADASQIKSLGVARYAASKPKGDKARAATGSIRRQSR